MVLAISSASLLLSSCSIAPKNTTDQGKQSLYDRVIQSGKIRCGYVIDPPGCIKDPNTGKLSGIGIEAVELIGKKLGLVIDWTEEVGWGTMLEGLQTGRYDMVATPIWTNANRAKIVAFSEPLYFSPIFVYAKKGDHRFVGHLEKIDLPSVKIATVDGDTGQVIADADYPKAGRLSSPQMTDLSHNLLSVATGKADVAFADPTLSVRYVINNPNSVENISRVHPVRVFPNCLSFARGEFEFKAMFDTVLQEVMNSGAMDKIISKYEAAPNVVYRAALPYQFPK
jgi:polar amino acid transport system substrate-binding protein